MLDIKPLNYKYCPFCRTKLVLKFDDDRDRKYCKSCKWIYFPQVFDSVAAIIKKDNNILLVKRATKPYKNTWMFPGGFVEFAEHPEETLIREVKEETGLKVKNPSIFEIVQTEDDYRVPGNIILFYEVTVRSGSLKTDKEENIDIDWFPLTKVPKIGFVSHKHIVKQLKRKYEKS